MNETLFKIQVRHLRQCLAALRVLDLDELERRAQQHGTYADQTLISALRIALDNLPDDGH